MSDSDDNYRAHSIYTEGILLQARIELAELLDT